MQGTALPLTPSTSSSFCHAHSQVHTVSWCSSLNTRYAWMCAWMLGQGYFSGHKSKRLKLLKGSDVQYGPIRACTLHAHKTILSRSLCELSCIIAFCPQGRKPPLTWQGHSEHGSSQTVDYIYTVQIDCGRQLSFQAHVWKLSHSAFN